MPPPVVIYRSIFLGRLLYAVPGWLLEEMPRHIVTATVPGAETRQLVGPREDVIRSIATGRERTEVIAWRTNRVVWLTPFGAAHAIGHLWNNDSGAFLGYYINLQAPIRRSVYGFDSFDHVLDLVVRPDGSWQWKDEDEFDQVIELGLFTPDEALAIRAEGERVIASLPELLPTGWEDWRPDPSWSVDMLILPPEVRDGRAGG
jgi:Protein of unknown function (DUF402)